MDPADIAAEVADLIFVATEEWLQERADGQLHEQEISLLRAERRGRLKRMTAAMSRVAEVDARIALLEATPAVPRGDIYLRSLLEMRSKLLAQARSKS